MPYGISGAVPGLSILSGDAEISDVMGKETCDSYKLFWAECAEGWFPKTEDIVGFFENAPVPIFVKKRTDK